MTKIYDRPVNVRPETADTIRELAKDSSLSMMAVASEAVALYKKKYPSKREPAERLRTSGGKCTLAHVTLEAGELLVSLAKRDGRALYAVMQEAVALRAG